MQSLVVQHVPAGMQLFDAPQATNPGGHALAPPGPEHTEPMTLQSALVQQVPLAMQLFDAAQTCCPVGHAQTPPGPGHI